MKGKVNFARQSALHMVRFSANARDVHLLRALGDEAVAEARIAHDQGIKVATAGVLAQYLRRQLRNALTQTLSRKATSKYAASAASQTFSKENHRETR